MTNKEIIEEIYSLADEIVAISRNAIKDITNHSTDGVIGDETGCPLSFEEARSPHYIIKTLSYRICELIENKNVFKE